MRSEEEGREGKPEKYLYICGENQSRVDEIEKLLADAIPNIHKRVQLLTYTDPEEFASHAQRILITQIRSVVGICIGLSPKTVDDYFGAMCRLATALLPKFNTKQNLGHLRLALASLYTFGKLSDRFVLSPKNDAAWSHFLEIRGQDVESSWDINDRFIKPLFCLDQPGEKHFIKVVFGLRLDM